MSAQVAVTAGNSRTVLPTPPLMERSGRGNDTSVMEMTTDKSQGNLPTLRSSVSMDKSKPLPTSLQSDFIPEDVLFALTQLPTGKDQLGPPSRHRNLTTSTIQTRQRPANVWNFTRRDRFKHLTENTTCICGAGRDISFLYDVPQAKSTPERPEKFDNSVIRKDAEEKPKPALQLPDTLLPEEYHIVKNKGVLGLEYHEDKYSTQAEDHEKHLVKFPSLKPASRYEVIQLKQALDEMLEKAGVEDHEIQVRGPTQMHNLLDLIKKEQNIYNVVFHELIRQVSIECLERGELLSALRDKYSNLLNKVPQQIKSLHEEVMAQRALDRRLTEELMRFKNTIGVLTSELTDVKEHDQRVTKEAQKAQEDLKTALAEAQKNASLLAEYHDLYELQRRRLERQVFTLSDEKDLWSTAAYSLALKVTEEYKLTTAKRMQVSEKSWAKLANHFTVLLSDKDTEQLTEVQCHVEVWRDLIEEFNFALKQREEEMREHLKGIKGGVECWLLDFQKTCFDAEGMLVKVPDQNKMLSMRADIREWEENLSKEAEVFAGDLLLTNQDELLKIRKEMDGWTDRAIKVFGRHSGIDKPNHTEQDNMIALNDEVEELLKQFQNRISGENGVATSVIHLANAIETWETRITSALNGTITIQESEWNIFYDTLEDWLVSVDQCLEYVGTTQKQDDRQEGREHTRIDVHETVRKTQKWATTASNAIDSEDAKLVEQVSSLHSEMVHWMVQVLLRIAPDMEGNSIEAGEMALMGSASIPLLHENAKYLFERLQKFSNYVTLCCDGIVIENTQLRQENNDEHADHEIRDLQKLRTECEEWISTAKILTSQLTGDPIEELFPPLTLAEVQSRPPPSPMSQAAAPDRQDTMGGTQDQKPKDEKSLGPTPSTNVQPQQQVDSSADSGGQQSQEQEQSQMEQKDPAVEEAIKPREEQQKKEQEAAEQLERIGMDDNTHKAKLQTSTDKAPEESTAASKKPHTPDTKRAFEALAAVDSLQVQLLATEQRAQEAEERAASAELELTQLQEQLRAAERKVAQTASVSDIGTPVSQIVSSPSPSLTKSPQPSKSESKESKEEKKASSHSFAKKSAKGRKK